MAEVEDGGGVDEENIFFGKCVCVGSDKEEVGNKDRKPNNAKKTMGKLRRISNYLVKINNDRISD